MYNDWRGKIYFESHLLVEFVHMKEELMGKVREETDF